MTFHLRHGTLKQLRSMGSMGVTLGRTVLASSLLHSRTDHSSAIRALTKPAAWWGRRGADTEVRRVEKERKNQFKCHESREKKERNAKTMTRQREVTGFVQSHHARSCGGHLRHHHAIAELLTATHLHDREISAAIQATQKKQ